MVQVSGSVFMCSTCYPKARNGQVPDVSIHNNFKLDDAPTALLGLSALEVSRRHNLNLCVTNKFTFMYRLQERFVAPRLPFMQIRTVGHDRSKFLRGHVVNVPSDVADMVRVLPRTVSETEVVQVSLKRKASHSASLFSDGVRPAKIKAALEYLMTTPLYRDEGIKVS